MRFFEYRSTTSNMWINELPWRIQAGNFEVSFFPMSKNVDKTLNDGAGRLSMNSHVAKLTFVSILLGRTQKIIIARRR